MTVDVPELKAPVVCIDPDPAVREVTVAPPDVNVPASMAPVVFIRPLPASKEDTVVAPADRVSVTTRVPALA